MTSLFQDYSWARRPWVTMCSIYVCVSLCVSLCMLQKGFLLTSCIETWQSHWKSPVEQVSSENLKISHLTSHKEKNTSGARTVWETCLTLVVVIHALSLLQPLHFTTCCIVCGLCQSHSAQEMQWNSEMFLNQFPNGTMRKEVCATDKFPTFSLACDLYEECF